MKFENVTEFVNNMEQNNRVLERKKDFLAKLVKQIQKEEAKLESQKIKAQKILQEIQELQNGAKE